MLKEFINNIDEAKVALMGTILADGSLEKQRTSGNRSKPNSCLEITHTSRSLDYLQLKKEILEMIPGVVCRIRPHNKHTEDKNYLLFRVSTNKHPWFTEVRDNIYDENRKKHLRKKDVDSFTDLSLLLMYLDDGSLKVRYYKGTDKIKEFIVELCTEAFTLGEVEYFRKWLKEKYDIDTHIYKRKSKTLSEDRGFRIWTNTGNTKKFMKVIEKFYGQVPSMSYKFIQNYLM